MAAPRENRQLPSSGRQHQRFSWQTPPETPPEEAQLQQQPPQYSQPQPQARPRVNTDLSGQQHSRVFSYAQTPAEHLAFQYIPSPSEPVPPLPRSVTPIDPRPQSIHATPAQPQLQPAYPSPSHHQQHRVSLSPLSSQNRSPAPQPSPVSPIAEPPTIHDRCQVPPPVATQPTQTHHARNLSNLVRINTNVANHRHHHHQRMPPVPATPLSHKSQASPLPTKAPMTPITPNSIKKDRDPTDYPLPMSPNSHKSSYAHEPYSPHGFSATTNTHHGAVFSPDSAHGPNGLDFSMHRPGQIAHPNMDLSSGTGANHSWKHALCACTPAPADCLAGLLCPCVLYGRTAYRLSRKSAKEDPTDLLSYSATNGHCVLMALACGFWWVFPLAQRIRIRHAYKLEGGVVGDCARAACCCCCVAVQNEREVREREESSRRWAGPASSEVYTRTPQMVYSPQA